jgi:hypothetical protein
LFATKKKTSGVFLNETNVADLQRPLKSAFYVVASALDAEESFWAKCLHPRSAPADQYERKE